MINWVILIGDINVGKTSFVYSLTDKSQNNITPTMGIDFVSTFINVHGMKMKVEIWDTSKWIYNHLSWSVNLPFNNIDLL